MKPSSLLWKRNKGSRQTGRSRRDATAQLCGSRWYSADAGAIGGGFHKVQGCRLATARHGKEGKRKGLKYMLVLSFLFIYFFWGGGSSNLKRSLEVVWSGVRVELERWGGFLRLDKREKERRKGLKLRKDRKSPRVEVQARWGWKLVGVAE